MRKKRNWLPLLAVLVMAVLAMTTGAFAAGEEAAEYVSPFHATAWSLLPPVIAIGLALITKEVYSSLFIGILAGGLLYSGFQFEGTVLHVFQDGVVSVLSDSYNVGILIFLVILGAMVCLMNKAGGSAAFGRWEHQKPGGGAAGLHRAGRADLYRRLLQLPHCGLCDAPHHRQAQCFSGKAGLSH